MTEISKHKSKSVAKKASGILRDGRSAKLLNMPQEAPYHKDRNASRI